MTSGYRRHRRAWAVALTVLLSISLFLTVASAVGLALTQTAAAAPASDSAGQSGDIAAKGNSDIFSRRDAQTLQSPYYFLLPLVWDQFSPYYPSTLASKSYLTGVFTFGSIFTCVLLGLVILSRRK